MRVCRTSVLLLLILLPFRPTQAVSMTWIPYPCRYEYNTVVFHPGNYDSLHFVDSTDS
jgi:hypothetical protein